MNKSWFGLVCVSVALAANACGSDEAAVSAGSGGSGGSSAGKGGASTAGAAGKAGSATGAGVAGVAGDGGTSGAGASVAGASDGGADTAAGAGGAAEAGAGGADPAACNSVELQGESINKTSNVGPAPTMTGGAIPFGTYVLTAINKYNGTQGSTQRRQTFVVSAGHIQLASENSGVMSAWSATYTAVGTVLSLSITCPAEQASNIDLQYTYANGVLQTQSQPNSTDQEIDVLTRQ